VVAAVLAVALAGLGCAANVDAGGPSGDPVAANPPEGRLVEEGDVVKTAATRLYVLSAKRGLMVVELAVPSAPRLLAAAALWGTPLELYLRDGWAYVVVAGQTGSEVRVYDVSAPAQVVLRAQVQITGAIGDSRLVGEVLYVVSDRGSTVQSIDLHDPAHPRAVDVVTFPGNAGNSVHMTDTTLFVASLTSESKGECRQEGSYHYRGPCTRITALDTRDPHGRIGVGATSFVNGALIDRFGLDHFQGVLRVLVATTRFSNAVQPARLRTFRAPDAFTLDPLAAIPLVSDRPESLMSVRFDGPRAFAVTFEQTDPLFTIDLSAAENPRVMGHLHSPGWVDFMVPAGDRLIGVGHDRVDSDRNEPWKLHASIYDVTNLAKPALLDRKLFGNAPAQAIADKRDNWAKVVKVVPELGLLLVPYNARDYRLGAETGALQLLGFSPDQLRLGGQITQRSAIRRALPLASGHVVTVSDSDVEVIDVTDLTSPRVLGHLENSAAAMARLVNGGFGAEVQP
jgi:uncharacterized secreted protein with C-terminal beta-propeller domain